MKTQDKVLVGDQNIVRRALARAKVALEKQKTDFGVGFCEGVIEIEQRLYTSVWCAVMIPQGKYSLSGGIHIPLSNELLYKYKNNVLTEKEIETFILSHFSQGYESLIEHALLPYTK